MIYRVLHDREPASSLRFLEASDGVLEVGQFIRLEDRDSLYFGDFLVVEVEAPERGWGIRRHPCLHLLPLSVQGSMQKLYTLIVKA
jgi:hypothetical protein